ncbi:MAG: pyridoxal phosphate-dependent aminotransferase [Planctomycetota bacterium]
MTGPLNRLRGELPSHLKGLVERQTPIPSIAQRAGAKQKEVPTLVRADIGQISGLDPELEVLYGSPVGLERTRELIAESWNLSFGLAGREGFGDGLTPANVAVTTGAGEALAVSLRAAAHDAIVAIPTIHWENYLNGVQAAKGSVAPVKFFDDEGRLDTDHLREQIRECGARVLLSNFPANPTGAVLSEDEARSLGRMAEELDLVVISDEVYVRLRYDGQPPQTLLTAAPDHVIAVGAASKEYLMPGARVGYAISAHTEVTDFVLRKLIRTASGSPNVLGQARLNQLLESDVADLRAGREPGILTKVRDEMASRRAALVEVLTKHGFPLRGRPKHEPQGTIFLMVGLPDWFDGSDEEFVERALESGCVSCVPGGAFGLPGALRFSYGGMTEQAIVQLDSNFERFRSS